MFVGCSIWDMVCSGYGIFEMWDVRDMGCLGCGMFKMWDVWDVICLAARMSGIRMLGIWDDWVVGFS